MPVTNYVWDELSDNVLMETDESDATIAVYTSEPAQFGELISQRRGGQTSYYHFDGNQSTRALTDTGESVTDTAAYSGFGEEFASSGNTPHPFGYQGGLGYYGDDEVDQVYVRSRCYAPVVARWLSPDQLGFTDGSNRYVLTNNNPLLYADPSGFRGTINTYDGTNRCWGSPKYGEVQYITGRGGFSFISMTARACTEFCVTPAWNVIC